MKPSWSRQADVVLEPEVHQIDWNDFSRVDEAFRRGRRRHAPCAALRAQVARPAIPTGARLGICPHCVENRLAARPFPPGSNAHCHVGVGVGTLQSGPVHFLLPYWCGACARLPRKIRQASVTEFMIGSLEHLFHFLFNVKGLIEWGGTLLVCVIVFIETGFFVGFFLPGDSLLVTAGVFAATGQLHLAELLIFVPLCAIVGTRSATGLAEKRGRPCIAARIP